MDIPTKSNNLSFNPINIGIDIFPLRKKGVFDIEFNKDRSLREYGNTRGEACGRSTLSTSLVPSLLYLLYLFQF